jgi:hypothetical protein
MEKGDNNIQYPIRPSYKKALDNLFLHFFISIKDRQSRNVLEQAVNQELVVGDGFFQAINKSLSLAGYAKFGHAKLREMATTYIEIHQEFYQTEFEELTYLSSYLERMRLEDSSVDTRMMDAIADFLGISISITNYETGEILEFFHRGERETLAEVNLNYEEGRNLYSIEDSFPEIPEPLPFVSSDYKAMVSLEYRLFINRLIGDGYFAEENPGQGNCLFHAIATYLAETHGFGHRNLRAIAVEYMRYNYEYYQDRVTVPLFNYLEEMANDRVYGGHLEVDALVNALGLPGHVHRAEGNVVDIHPRELEADNDLQDGFRVGYIGEHYFLLRTIENYPMNPLAKGGMLRSATSGDLSLLGDEL